MGSKLRIEEQTFFYEKFYKISMVFEVFNPFTGEQLKLTFEVLNSRVLSLMILRRTYLKTGAILNQGGQILENHEKRVWLEIILNWEFFGEFMEILRLRVSH